MGDAPQRLGIDRPAGQLLQQRLCLAERLVNTRPDRHAASASREPALQSQEGVGDETDRAARRTAAVPTLDVNGSDGGHDFTPATPLQPAVLATPALPRHPFFSSALSTHDWTACWRLARTRSLPAVRDRSSQTSRT